MAESASGPGETPTFERRPFLDRKDEEDISIKQILTRNETFLAELRSQQDANLSRQNELLEAILGKLESNSTTRLLFISEAALQIFYLTVAVIFGVFGVWGVILQLDGNLQALIQNGINLVAFCEGINSVRITAPIDEGTTALTRDRQCTLCLAMTYGRLGLVQ
jgi:hypothetical protein